MGYIVCALIFSGGPLPFTAHIKGPALHRFGVPTLPCDLECPTVSRCGGRLLGVRPKAHLLTPHVDLSPPLSCATRTEDNKVLRTLAPAPLTAPIALAYGTETRRTATSAGVDGDVYVSVTQLVLTSSSHRPHERVTSYTTIHQRLVGYIQEACRACETYRKVAS